MFRSRRKATDGMEAYLADADGGVVVIVVASAVVEAKKWEIENRAIGP